MKNTRLLCVWVVFIGLSSCSSSSNRNQYVRRDDSAPLVDEKYSLTSDREKLRDLRSEVPEDRRRENDELATILSFFQDNRSPSDVRSKFDSVVRKKRETLNKDLQRERERFTKEERKSRDLYLKNQKEERESFLRGKPDKDRRDEFLKDQDEKRKEFFANERERRSDFESDMRERRNSFEAYMREKQSEFNQEHRIYTREYDEKKKQKEKERLEREKALRANPAPEARRQETNSVGSEAQQLERELNEIRNRPSQQLGTEE